MNAEIVISTNGTMAAGEPWLSLRFAKELQRVKTCPVGGGTEPREMYQDLVDHVFFVAPDRYSLESYVGND